MNNDIDNQFLDTLNQVSKTIKENDNDFNPFSDSLNNLNNKINVKYDSVLTISKGNIKIDHPYFSLPAGHTCPFAKICKTKVPRDRVKIHDNLIERYGELQCYAASMELIRPYVQRNRWRNKDLLDKQNGIDETVKLILNSLKVFELKENTKIEIFRVHESGDFYNLEYFNAWLEVAKNRGDILFYAYTKSLPFWVENKHSIPSNFKLVASYGGTFDDLITAQDLRNAKIVNSPEEAKELKLPIDIKDTLAYNSDKNFALLLHGMQPAGDLAKTSKRNSKTMKSIINNQNNNDVNENKNIRSWSSKFWKNKDVNEVLKEVIEPEQVDVSDIKMNDTLNPLIWNEDQTMKDEIRKSLLMNAKRFIEFSDVENLKFNDIILTGSLANYNYTDKSDLDVHIVLDFNQISENKEFVGDFLKLKKQLWTDKLPIQIKGHDVELYFQDSSEPHHSTGTFSLIDNDWINKPTKKIININVGDIQLKSSDYMNAIDDLEKNNNNEDFLKRYEKLKNKIKMFRQSGLDTGGEYSTENLVFKVLRNTGYLGKMVELKNNYLTKELSLNEFTD